MKKTLIIAEAGVNHNGKEEFAFKLIDEAVDANSDIVKFQLFSSKEIASSDAKLAKYQSTSAKMCSQQSMLQQLELPNATFINLSLYCKERGIEFLSTAFDDKSLDFLLSHLAPARLKISSGDLTNLPFIFNHAKTNLHIILSTGMSTLPEIRLALATIAYGILFPLESHPSIKKIEEVFNSLEGQKVLNERVTLLHCTSSYPTPTKEINLNALHVISDEFQLPVGFSDHSNGIFNAISAVAMGAEVIEKHFTLDKAMQGPDHKASLNPLELNAMIKEIRNVELAKGNFIKVRQDSEKDTANVARKSLVASREIQKGEVFTRENLTCKRPGTGISPSKYWDYLGQKAKKRFLADEMVF